MKIAFDTSVLVAAAVGSHPRHKEAATQLEFAREETHAGFLCSHATAEIFSVLTKLPLVQRISPAEAFSVIQALRGLLVVVPVDDSSL